MFLQRTAITAARRAAVAAPVVVVRRTFTTTMMRREGKVAEAADNKVKPYKSLKEVKEFDDLIGPGAAPGTIPTDLEQATGLERLELLGKMEGVDVFDMKPLDSSRLGTMDNPIMVKSAGEEQYAGCTGCPADSHETIWLTMSKARPLERCPECGSVYKMEYIGPEDDGHGHHHGPEEPKTIADFVKPEYYYT